MIFTIITSKRNIIRKHNYYLQIQTVYVIKFKQKMCTKIFGKIKDKFDFSDYDESSQFYDKTTKLLEK